LAEPAVKELETLDQNIKIQWRSFELRPDPVELLDPNGDYLVSAWQNHVFPLAAKMKMPLQRPPIQPRSRLAHEAAKWADTQNCFEEYNLALFRAFFEHGRDIGDIEILKELAADLNLDNQSLDVALSNNEFTPAVLADEDEAIRVGVRAVPAFVVSGIVKAAGVQSAQRLYELISEGQGVVNLKK
jgi:predicted DsbA family dithiol-disulfide isomerase